MRPFLVRDTGKSITITLPKDNLKAGLESLGDYRITDPDTFFAFFAENFMTAGYVEGMQDSVFYKLLDIVGYAAAQNDKGTEWVDFDKEFDEGY